MRHHFKRNFCIIVCVFSLALYYILPTCLYYSRPLNKKIGEKEAQKIIHQLVDQVVSTREDTEARIAKILSSLKVKGRIEQHPNIPNVVNVVFKEGKDANIFLENLIYGEPYVPVKSARLHVLGYNHDQDAHIIQVSGSLLAQLSEHDFSFVPYQQDNIVQPTQTTLEKVAHLLTSKFRQTCACGYAPTWETAPAYDVIQLAQQLSLSLETFSEIRISSLFNYFFSSSKEYASFITRLENLNTYTKLSDHEKHILQEALDVLKNVRISWNTPSIQIVDNFVDLTMISPLFDSMNLHPEDGLVTLHINSEIAKQTNLSLEQQMNLHAWLEQEKQRLAHAFQCSITSSPDSFTFNLRDKNASGCIVFQGDKVYRGIVEHLTALVLNRPSPQSCDFFKENFPVLCRQPKESDACGCFVFSPEDSCSHFKRGSVYIVLKGLRSIIAKYEHASEEDLYNFERDLQHLHNCFSHTNAISWNLGEDKILEIREPLQVLFDLWGENFRVEPLEGKAYLEVYDVRNRLEVTNQIEKAHQEEWVRWSEQYKQASYSIDPRVQIRSAVPHKNAFIENIKLNIRKYLRGNDVLRLGIDFSGGRHIRLAFKDHRGQLLTDKDDIAKVSDELYSRLNRLGVSEVEIVQEGNHINVNLPGSTKISSQDILGSSRMSFHVVNEKFSEQGQFYYETQRFLDYLWFLAQSQGEISVERLNHLAYQMLNDETLLLPHGVKEAIAVLKKEGLAFSEEGLTQASSQLDVTYSIPVIIRDSEKLSNPLMLVFRNYALEGGALQNIHSEFTMNEGYILNFSVKDKLRSSDGSFFSPTDHFYDWTSKYCQQGIAQTPEGQFTSNRGWRMAVVLNGTVISDPVLNVPLREHATVSGKFSHREITRLTLDLKSGNMSYVPEILCEEVTSSELGHKQKVRGLVSVVLGLVVLIVLMSVYYKFGGIIASIAVVLNLLLIWAALQYLDAPLTLSGLAGVILAMGMAVDANVLVFERIREEYLLSRSLKLSVDAGYKKAFAAILDSNLTTVLASFLLLLLDTGPIRGFALTLILGIISSMFTALFMTKCFFVFWMHKTQETQLHMMNKFIGIKHDFLKECKHLWVVSGAILFLGIISLGCGAWDSVLGIDFKGGYALTLNLSDQAGQLDATRHQLNSQFDRLGLSSRDVRIKVFKSSDKLKIYFSQKAIDKVAAVQTQSSNISDPNLSCVASLLSEMGIDLSEDNVNEIGDVWLQVKGQFSKRMRQQAVIALFAVFVVIMIYVSVRFEWQYAFSAIFALVHDLLATCSVLIMTHFFLQKIQFDLQAVGALMTVLGYSLNNTIIIFDRIREDRREKLFTPMPILINDALQKTLGRTVMTTATTLSVLLILLFVGGGTVFNFAFILTIGILLGTLSSLYIAPPFLLFMLRKEEKKNGLQTK